MYISSSYAMRFSIMGDLLERVSDLLEQLSLLSLLFLFQFTLLVHVRPTHAPIQICFT